MFRVAVLVQHSESSCLSFVQSITIFLISGIQSHWTRSFGLFESSIFLVLAFRAVLHTHSCILSHHLFLSSSVQSHCTYLFKHLESSSFCVWCSESFLPTVSFRVTVLTFMFTSITHLAFRGLHLSSFSSSFILCLSLIRHCFSKFLFSLFMT